ncbi:hypothetical protein K1W54_04825 [Micromonospora sp. CPCC 205371]|nr:hypothetical protein [Micromonospora sp. CPCC 205371]
MTSSSEPRALPTTWAGVTFRSRHEARWAVFFDHLDLRWDYEPERYTLGTVGGTYLPDFYLPDIGLFAEIKPGLAGDVDPEGVWRWEQFAAAQADNPNGGKVAMFCDRIPDPTKVTETGPPKCYRWFESGVFILGDWHYAWCACPSGDHFDVQYEARGGRIFCGCFRIADDHYRTGDHPRILAAYEAARSERFEGHRRNAA